jgi:hypothetical protein
MLIKFQKLGLVPVGTNEESQTVNLQDPIGFPINVNINIINETIELTINANDNRNSIVRSYDLQMDEQAKLAFLQFFGNEIRRIARDSYDEFKDLVETP